MTELWSEDKKDLEIKAKIISECAYLPEFFPEFPDKDLSKEELVFLKLFMFDAWFYCDVRNYSHDDRKLFHSIKRKLSQELINA